MAAIACASCADFCKAFEEVFGAWQIANDQVGRSKCRHLTPEASLRCQRLVRGWRTASPALDLLGCLPVPWSQLKSFVLVIQ